MRRQKSRSRSGRGDRPAGAVGLLLVLCLMALGVTPAIYADSPPQQPHQFYGTVVYDGAPVAEDTLVEAFVDDVKKAETTVDAEGRYGYDPSFRVSGTAGAEVTFEVGGVPTEEKATWQSGKVQRLDLTIDEEPASPVPRYVLTMAAVPEAGGSATDETGEFPYLEGAIVDIKAEAEEGYEFVNWTSDPQGIIDDEDAPETFLTMPGEDATVTANFDEVPINDLTVTSEAGGSVNVTIDEKETLIGAGQTKTISDVAGGTEVNLVATPADGYRFIEWVATAGEFDDAKKAETTFTMPDEEATVTASFAEAYELTMAEDPADGGTAIDLTDEAPYIEGAEVQIRGQANPGYRFTGWTASAGHLAEAEASITTFTMPGQAATVTASFEPADTYGLTLVASPEAGGMPVDVTDEGPYFVGTVVIIQAEPNPGYLFLSWTAPAGVLGNASNPTTTFTMPAESVVVTAHYEAIPYSLTVVANPAAMGNATDVTAASPYIVGEVVYIRAQANEGYGFVNWTSDPEGIIDDEEDAETFLTMPAEDVIVTANFESRPTVPTVATEAATGVNTNSARLNMTYTTGNYSAVDLRFAIKRATDVTWFHDIWVSRTEDGTYTYVLTDLSSNIEYEFRAQLKYDDTVIEGEIRRFITASQADVFFPPFCFIATAAYGTPTAEEIDVLREFRDEVLLDSAAGSRFVALYYRLSPPVAGVIAANGFLQTVVRELLVDPAVWIVRATGGMWRS